MLANKVVELNKDNLKVYDQIQRYFDKLERKSKRTREKYEGDIRFYFKFMWGKELEHLINEDVQLSLDDYENFIKKLLKLKNKKGERYYTNKTVNGKVTSIKGLSKYLAAKGIVKDISYFPLIEFLDENSEQYDAFKVSEVLEMSRLALQEKEKPLEKSLLILFALNSGMRKSEILNVKWSDFTVKDETVVIKGIGKGNKSYKKYISLEFYNELLQIKSDNKFVFSIPKPTLDKLFERLRDRLNLDDNRWLTFHSIRKCSASKVQKLTKDINITRKFLNHSSVNTTQIYIDEDDDILSTLCIIDNIDSNLYKTVEHQVLIKAIAEMDQDYQAILNRKLSQVLEIEK